jgi:hypothetical protein
MVDQSIQFLKGIAKNIRVKIQDHYALADFIILDMDLHKSTFSSQKKRYAIVLIVILLMSSRIRFAPKGGDVNRPTVKRINSLRMDGGIMKEKLRRTYVNPD